MLFVIVVRNLVSANTMSPYELTILLTAQRA
jgi:hypothetical protein